MSGTPAALPPALPTTFRPYLARWVILALAVAVVAVIGFVTFALESFTTTDRVGMICIALLSLAGLWLLNRPRIKADERGLEVINVFRRRRLEWAEVVEVSLRPDDPWLVLDLDDGTTLAAMGVQSSDGKRARAAAGRLRALVQAKTTTPGD